MGRKLSDTYKLQGQGLPEIRQALMHAAADLNVDTAVREAACGSVTSGNLTVALTLSCLMRPDAELRAIAIRGLRALERLKDSNVPLDIRSMDRKDFGMLGGNPDEGVDAAATTRPRGARSRPQANRRQSKKTG